MDYRAALVAFYRKHNPLKLVEVDALLRKYKGREEELLQALRVKYKVNERDEPLEEPTQKAEEPVKVIPPTPEPPKMEAIKNDLPPPTQRVTYSDTDITRSGDNKGRTAAERAEYWRKELERREMEREKNRSVKSSEPKISQKNERLKVVREAESDTGEATAEKKPLNLKLLIGIAAVVILVTSALWILLNDNLRTSFGAKFGLGDEEAKTEEKTKKVGLDPGVLGNVNDSAKKSGEFVLEDEPDEKAPSVEDAMNEQPSSTVKQAPTQPERLTDESVAGNIQRKKFYIGYAAVASETTAKNMSAELRRKGFDNATYFYIPDYDPNGKELYRVCVGPFSTLEQAEEMAVNVRSENPSAYSFYLK